MKKLLLAGIVAVYFFCTGFSCNKEKILSGCIRAKLEIKGICMNYVISVQGGNIDPSLIEASWQDPVTNFTYHNVFALGSACTFPDNINEGDEFYFNVVGNSDGNCAVCLAYRPVPQKHLQIKANKTGCK